MAKTMRKTLLYGILLAAGVTLGMQLADSGTATVYGPGYSGGEAGANGANGANGQLPQAYGGGVPGYASSAWPANPASGWSGWQGGSAATGAGYGYGNYNYNYYGANGGYGTGTGSNGAPGSTSVNGGQTGPSGGNSAMQTPADLLLPPQTPPTVDRFADKAAHLLQQASQKSIHWVASLFDQTE
ncbi:hypothetical protein EHV15_30340 [Paenibacillus oralis]|uniref:Uncharacterized protein n=1 Tax=Paenibacillus oralis TaxID=2490856 RepID=A0A3P3U8S6_9BACL|nr:hypothetical protein [Paenibacillus oralis]RRJ66752.1 hypothetical protein EHV15_30340 [Paenibacillus oralis]